GWQLDDGRGRPVTAVVGELGPDDEAELPGAEQRGVDGGDARLRFDRAAVAQSLGEPGRGQVLEGVGQGCGHRALLRAQPSIRRQIGSQIALGRWDAVQTKARAWGRGVTLRWPLSSAASAAVAHCSALATMNFGCRFSCRAASATSENSVA